MRRTISILLSILLIFGNLVFAEDTTNQSLYARCAWDGTDSKNVYVGYIEGSMLTVTKAKTKMVQLNSGGATYIGLNLSDSIFKPNASAKSVAVTVKYFDEAEGAYFTIDHTTSASSRVAAEKVAMTGDGEIKEHTFYFDECYFKNDNAGFDFLIATWTSSYGSSSGPVYIQSVEVKECFPQKPASVEFSNGNLGNTFDDEDEKLMTVTVKNVTQETLLKISGTYEVLSYDKKHLEDGIIEETVVEPLSSEYQVLKFTTVDECNKYFINATLKYEGTYNGEKVSGEIAGDDVHFAVANKREPEEKLNPMVQTQVQFHDGTRASKQEELMKMVADAGMSGTREYGMWRTNNIYAPFKDYNFKSAFNLTDELGMTQNMMCMLGHSSLKGELWIPDTEEQIKAYCDYLEWFVKEYGDKFEYIEIWNEPNVYGGFNINYATPQQYTELVKRAYTTIKSVDPNMKVAVCSTATIHDVFIDPCIEAGILDYCDVMSCHPYDWDTNADKTGKDRIRNDVYRERANHLREKLDNAGHPEIEISWTELGVRSGELWASELGQASYLVQLMAIMQGEEVADNLYQFMFINPGMDSDLRTGESHWGLLYHQLEPTGPYAAKLGYLATAGYNKFLSDAKPVSNIVRDDTSVYNFKRETDGKNVIVLWSDNTYDNIGLDLGTNEIEVYDMYSNKLGDVKSKNGQYSFTTTFEPMYIVGNFSSFAECEPTISIDNARAFATMSDTATFKITDTKGRSLKIDAEARDDIEISKIDEMVNGNAKIVVKTAEELEDENTLRLKLYDGEDCVFITRVHVVRTQPMMLESSVEKVNDISSKTQANISITNNAAENSFSGTVTADFTEYGGKVETRYFENVKPQETVSVKLNIPDSLIQRTFNFDANVELDYGYSTTVTCRLTQLSANYAKESPPLTGTVDYNDWSGGDFFAADRAMDVRYKNDWSGKDDCSIIGKLNWDEDNLYLLAVVTDNVFFQDKVDSDIWGGDSLQFAVSTAEDRKLPSGGSFTEFGLANTSKGVQLWRYESLSAADKAMNVDSSTELEKNVEVTNCECTFEKQNGKYVYRAKIPWSEILPGVTKMDNCELGFSLLVNDNDGSGRGWLQFSDGIGSTKSASLYSMLTLSGRSE